MAAKGCYPEEHSSDYTNIMLIINMNQEVLYVNLYLVQIE